MGLREHFVTGQTTDGGDWVLGIGCRDTGSSRLIQNALSGLYVKRKFNFQKPAIAGRSLTRKDLVNLRDFAHAEGIPWKGGLTWPLCVALAKKRRVLDVRWFNSDHPIDVRYGELALFFLGHLRWGPWIYDGKKGTETVYAVKSFQKSLGNTQDGKLGPKQWAALAQKSGLFDAPGMSSGTIKPSTPVVSTTGYVRPAKTGSISARYRKPGSWAAGYHTGVDIAVPTGTPLYATKGGIVTSRGWGSAYGVVVYIAGDDGYDWGYCHMSRRVVSVGQRVKTGQLIGYSGNTGRSTGPHLHLEARRRRGGYGADTNPNRWP